MQVHTQPCHSSAAMRCPLPLSRLPHTHTGRVRCRANDVQQHVLRQRPQAFRCAAPRLAAGTMRRQQQGAHRSAVRWLKVLVDGGQPGWAHVCMPKPAAAHGGGSGRLARTVKLGNHRRCTAHSNAKTPPVGPMDLERLRRYPQWVTLLHRHAREPKGDSLVHAWLHSCAQ